MWAGIWVGGIIGPFFFDGGNVNASSYLEMVQKQIVPTIEREMDLEEVVYMHDGAPAHYARVVRHYLDETFPDRWIGRRGWIDWPARSPDLTPADFFLWGVVKDRVYATKPQSLQALKDAVTTQMRSLPQRFCQSACQSVRERLQLCRDLNGEHIEQYL